MTKHASTFLEGIRPEIENTTQTTEDTRKGRCMHADVVALARNAILEMLETTHPERMELVVYAHDSDLLAMALTLFDPVDVVSITSAVLSRERGSTQEVEPEFLDRQRHAKRVGVLWDNYDKEYTAPPCRMGERLRDSVAIKRSTRESEAAFRFDNT